MGEGVNHCEECLSRYYPWPVEYPVIIKRHIHLTKRGEAVLLGKEAAGDNHFYTQRVNPEGRPFWGHYRLTLEEALEDFEERRSS
jgi:hypothetical protein|tara:strand:+ start:1069 stop:1323 length:255 start_codon:yes stop_codon:yes gene_type:complete